MSPAFLSGVAGVTLGGVAVLGASVAQAQTTYGPGPGAGQNGIPDNNLAGVASAIIVNTQNRVVTSLNSVTVTGLTHSWMGDLTATLSHGGTSVNLFARPGGANDSSNFNGTYTFNATASQTVAQATAALGDADLTPGNYRSSGGLSAFAGIGLEGDWVLRIVDQGADDVGTFTGWQFNATSQAAPVGTYSNNTSGDIPDGSSAGVTSDIVVSDIFQVNTFDSVTIRGLQHSLVGDLTARVTNVNTGTTVDLFARPGRTTTGEFDFGDDSNLNGNYTFTLGGSSFADAAGQGNTAYTVPAGTYAASTSQVPGEANSNTLATFNGTNINGTWRLSLIDSEQGDIGSFSGWGFNVTPANVVIPEPSAGAFYTLGLGLLGIAGSVARHRKRANIGS